MEYTLRIARAMHGDTIPLYIVAEAMARHAASGYGTLTLHLPTLEDVRPEYIDLLLDEVKAGRLKTSDTRGGLEPVEFGAPGMVTSADRKLAALTSLSVRLHHLNVWGGENGDSFHVVDAAVNVVEFDLRDESGNVIEAGYYRSMVAWDDGQAEHPAPAGETQDQRCIRLLRWFEEEELKGKRGALARVVQREKRNRKSVTDDIGRARLMKSPASNQYSQLMKK